MMRLLCMLALASSSWCIMPLGISAESPVDGSEASVCSETLPMACDLDDEAIRLLQKRARLQDAGAASAEAATKDDQSGSVTELRETAPHQLADEDWANTSRDWDSAVHTSDESYVDDNMVLDSSLQADASGKCTHLNACSTKVGFGPASCKKPHHKTGKCPCAVPSQLRGAFVASWGSSPKEQRSWNPVWGHLHMSVHEKACRPACNLEITLSFHPHRRTGCSDLYLVKNVHHYKGDHKCFEKFKSCFDKHGEPSPGWHTVIAPGHSPKNRHWKWIP
jgi:hypothetical protein